MRRIAIVFLLIAWAGCDRYPSNPDNGNNAQKLVVVEHIDTHYVPANPPTDGLVANRVNVLFFRVQARNFEPEYLEVYGRVVFDGAPENSVYAIHFRTDSTIVNPVETGYEFNSVTKLQPGSTYTLVRPQFPTNEFAPFTGTLGMVKSVTITEVWAKMANGNRLSVPVHNSY